MCDAHTGLVTLHHPVLQTTTCVPATAENAWLKAGWQHPQAPEPAPSPLRVRPASKEK